MMRHLFLIAALLAPTVPFLHAQGSARRAPLGDPEIDAIAHLLKLEDTRQFDEAALERLLASRHPEVRRRAIVTVGRITGARIRR